MFARPVDPEEAKWRRQDDARTLARAKEIEADSERLKEAKKGAKEILEQEAERLRGLSKVAHNATVENVVKKGAKKDYPPQSSDRFERTMTRTRRKNPATIGKL